MPMGTAPAGASVALTKKVYEHQKSVRTSGRLTR